MSGCCATSPSTWRRARRSRSWATPAPARRRSFSYLLRFYDIQRGQILLDGVDIRELSLTALRRMFGIVLQDPFLFTGTLESNVKLGTAWIDRAGTEAALREVGLGPYLESQTEGRGYGSERARLDAVCRSAAARQLCARPGA